ncbi:hypothetical protein A2866_05025 [Candidatus Roizmanbacteria bacterium RIFCSPHIGHO2_01_FULL_39_8]|uniref:YknX-like C-terminal permuted SH3-like domain-containing protein n=1 Tax=Candidatus Roizmanbacteria bacterium RIFCSPHIGHO2_01_FULL_39_8 TaxID=1802033 RepID=A0A1F7GJB0_9BACT|nr:MAG: hypothetical protein A2866_05025 [Candidatus Roizmanbacteria bacterium RIFCSPHIGHO2_01_FULL_39_8]
MLLMKKVVDKIKKLLNTGKRKLLFVVEKRPFASFFAFLFLFLILIVISNFLGTPKIEEEKETLQTKSVRIYRVGSAPKLTVQAQIEKSGVVTITSLMGGVVQTIYKNQGEEIDKGQWLIGLSSNYQGGNTFSLQRQIAQKQYQTAKDTHDKQKDSIDLQKKIAEKGHVMAEDLRAINEQSIAGISSLVSLNSDILSSLDSELNTLSQNSASNSALILSTKQLKSQFLAANNQAQASLTNTQYQSSDDNAPAELTDLQKNLTIKQLEVQKKMLDLNLEISKLQLQMAQVTEALMYPSSPFSGIVQRVFVKVGQAVTPGTQLAIINQTTDLPDPITAIAYVSADIARRISLLEPSILHLNGNTNLSLNPTYITQEAIQGSLYGVYFTVPDNYVRNMTEKGFIQVDLPIGHYDTSAVIPYIPVDAIYQTKDQSYIYIITDNKAQARSVELGNVYGSFVEVQKGLNDVDKVILDRNVIAGDPVKIIQ